MFVCLLGFIGINLGGKYSGKAYKVSFGIYFCGLNWQP